MGWFRGKRGGLVAWLAIAALVAGGLGWVTGAVLQLERGQLEFQRESELHAKLRLALWRLDSLMLPEISREASRPFAHYNSVYIPAPVLDRRGNPWAPGTVLELSPLLTAELPEWMLLHFSVAQGSGCWSPQVVSAPLQKRLGRVVSIPGADLEKRQKHLEQLNRSLNPSELLALLRRYERPGAAFLSQPSGLDLAAAPGEVKNQLFAQSNHQSPIQQSYADYQNRAGRLDLSDPQKGGKQQLNLTNSNSTYYGGVGPVEEKLLKPGPAPVSGSEVVTGPMTGLWLPTGEGKEELILARRVLVGPREVSQGIFLDWESLHKSLLPEVQDLFPEAQLVPLREKTPSRPERAMTTLPVELNPGPSPAALPELGWSPLRVGLALAWAAALVALLAVGLGGWSLLDLSERRIRFVSTVTHELRTPLTTLRLYLDMLTGGLVKGEDQREEYLRTLNAETDRLNRLVGNVLDFSRLENQRPRLEKAPVRIGEILDQLQGDWQNRCKECGKELVVENALGPDFSLDTDLQLTRQILGNLIDNACKYSRAAADPRLWLRVRPGGDRRLVFEVEDRGPGISSAERRSIFRPFRRGRQADVTAGGVGLGLALASRWASLLGGSLTVSPGSERTGACFRLEMPGT